VKGNFCFEPSSTLFIWAVIMPAEAKKTVAATVGSTADDTSGFSFLKPKSRIPPPSTTFESTTSSVSTTSTSSSSSLATVTTKTNKNVWSTVNDMNIMNCCWICNSKFHKKQIKKVFMISHIVDYMEKRKTTMQHLNEIIKEKQITPDEAYEDELTHEEKLLIEDINVETKNLAAMWTHYCELQGNRAKVDAEITKADLAPWFSGLACVSSEVCERTYNKLVTLDEANANANPRMHVRKPMSTECPPGCDCDNPWAFVAHVIEKQNISKK
jgi:hypothetical protein